MRGAAPRNYVELDPRSHARRTSSRSAGSCAARTNSSTSYDRHRHRSRRSAVVQGRDHLRDPHPRLPGLERRRHRRHQRPDRASSTTCSTSAITAIWLLPFYPSPLRDGGYDIADYTDVHEHYGTRDDFARLLARGAPPRHPRDHRARAQPHLGGAPVVPARAARAGRQPGARLLRVERHARRATRTPASSSRTSRPRTGRGIRSPRRTTGTGSTSTSPISTSTTRRSTTRCSRVIDFWLEMGVDGLRLDAVPVPLRARGHELREPRRRPTRSSSSCAPTSTASSRTACCSPRPTSGRPTPPRTSATATSAT